MTADPSSIVSELQERRAELLTTLSEQRGGLSFCHALSDLMDEAVRWIYTESALKVPDAPPVSIVATGGYGRRELAPFSDIDLAVIPLNENHVSSDALIRKLHRMMHDVLDVAFGVEIGYSYRPAADAPVLDGKSRSAMMDVRFVAGDPQPHANFQQIFLETFPTGDFLIDKIHERRARLLQHHDTPLVVEPHLKEGAGGLRSRHAANWIRRAIGLEKLEQNEHFDAILDARNVLHAVSGKPVDLLSRPRQSQIADLRHLDLADWLSSVAAHMEILHDEYLESEKLVGEAKYAVAPGVLTVRGRVCVQSGVDLGAAAMGIAIATGLGLEVERQDFESSGTLDGPEALHAIASGEIALRQLDRSGLLARLLPELERCRTLMPEDAAHTYTVFEHTMRAIQNLDRFDPGSFLGDLKSGLSSRGTLCLALLLHDTGKSLDDRPHSESGADLAIEVCRRWNLGPAISQNVVWLVREHLSLALVLRMRDIQNPQTAADLADAVKNRERLDLLTLLTAADIQAVSPSAWTPALENLMKELWTRTAAIFDAQSPPEHDPAVYRKRLLKALSDAELNSDRLERFLKSLPAQYVISTPAELIKMHLSFVSGAMIGNPTIELDHQHSLGVTEMTVCCLDAPALLSKILGVLYAWDLSVHTIRVNTASVVPPVALDTFTVSFGSGAVPPATCQHATADLLRVIHGEIGVEEVLTKHGKDPARRQEHFTYRFIEGDPAILEFSAPRGRGMAFRISRLLADQGWDIVSARVGQWAGQGAAAFYVSSRKNERLTIQEVEIALGANA